MREAMRRMYAPVFLLGFIGSAMWWVGYRGGSPTHLLPLLLLAIGCAFVAEAVLPYEPDWNRSHGDGARDLLHAVINELLNVLSLAVIPLLASLGLAADLWPTQWPFWLQVVAAVVAADLGITLAHRWSHRWELLWRFHAVHHSLQRMYGFNGLMKHPLHQAVEAACGVAPLLLLGMPLEVASVLAFAIAIQLLLQHGNVDMHAGGLARVFAWAPRHRYHHIRYGKAGDVNFGLFLTVWDHLMGTAFDGHGYRLSSADLGIGSRPDYPVRYWAQLREPFRPQSDQPSPPPPAGLRRSGQ